MARQAAGAVREPARTKGTPRKDSATPRRRGTAQRAMVLLEPLPVLLPGVETESKPTARREPSQEEIRGRAYQIYLSRGCSPGGELDDWHQAERELRYGKSA